MKNLSSIASLSEWPSARQDIEKDALELLGELPTERTALQLKTVDEDSFPGYVRRKVHYFVSDWERISAWLFIPEVDEEVPALLCCHPQDPNGKDVPAGIEGERSLAFARHYAEMGFVTIAPDTIGAGERRSASAEPFDTENFYKDYPKMSALGKMLADHIYAVDALSDTKWVDKERVGVIGAGLGGANAILMAAFDERVQACVCWGGFLRFQDDTRPERWTPDSGFVALPRMREFIESGDYPVDWEHLIAMSSPTPLLTISPPGESEASDSRETAVEEARTVYTLLAKSHALEHHVLREDDPDPMRVSDDFLVRWL